MPDATPVLYGEPGDATTPEDRHWRNEIVCRLEIGLSHRAVLCYGITGAFAMALHGYSRTTKGIDVILIPETITEFTYSLRTLAGLAFTRINESRYHATLPDEPDLTRRVTACIPEDQVSRAAILAAVSMPCREGGNPLRVIACDWLAVTKVVALAASKDVRHAADLQSMLARKMFDPARVRQLLVSLDPMRIWTPGFDQLMAKFAKFRNSCWPQKPKPAKQRKPRPKKPKRH